MRNIQLVTALVFVLMGCGEDLSTTTALPTSDPPALENRVPVINSLIASSPVVGVGGESEVFCDARDEDGDELRYTWGLSQGILTGSGSNRTYQAPTRAGVYFVTCQASDRKGAVAAKGVFITVGTALPPNHIPEILSFVVNINVVSGEATVACKTSDQDNDSLNSSLQAIGNGFTQVSLVGNDIHGTWTVPKDSGTYHLFCSAYNENESISAQLELAIDESGVLSLL